MKSLVFSIGLLAAVCFFGCGDNTPPDPNSELSKPNTQFVYDRINICCPVCDPLSGVCKVNGVVEYLHQVIAGPERSNGVYTILLTLEMNSQLCDRCMM